MNASERSWAWELDHRRSRLLEMMASKDCDAAIVFGSQGHTENFRYLTNFVPVLGDMWAIAPRHEAMLCVLNFTWQLEEARRLSAIEDWRGELEAVPVVLEVLAAHAPARIAVVGFDRIPAVAVDAIRTRFPKAELVDLSADVARHRRIKSDLELAYLREAGRVTDLALDVLYEEIEIGMTERELAARLDYAMQRHGAECAFPSCVISGVDDPIPIRAPTDRRIASGDSVMVDLGAAVAGYNADASRTVVIGRPTREQEDAWAVVTNAYDAALAAIRPGAPCTNVHRAAADVITDAGFTLAHRIGHGIGLATSFEWPSLDTEAAPLEAGMTFCVEPGVYRVGVGNMKLEDDVLVTDDGYELLTNARRTLAPVR